MNPFFGHPGVQSVPFTGFAHRVSSRPAPNLALTAGSPKTVSRMSGMTATPSCDSRPVWRSQPEMGSAANLTHGRPPTLSGAASEIDGCRREGLIPSLLGFDVLPGIHGVVKNSADDQHFFFATTDEEVSWSSDGLSSGHCATLCQVPREHAFSHFGAGDMPDVAGA